MNNPELEEAIERLREVLDRLDGRFVWGYDADEYKKSYIAKLSAAIYEAISLIESNT